MADKQFADAIKASKFNVAVGLGYVSFLRRHGGADRAYDFLTELANRWPNNVQVLSALAEAKLARKDWVGAQQIGETILRVSKARGVGDWILGVALSGEQKNDREHRSVSRCGRCRSICATADGCISRRARAGE